ncbi:MAG: hypothetical protein H0T73_08420 [Ardenticatenales bacterium]|nr:hypothetical protein [Ardenticatenales bacterium]
MALIVRHYDNPQRAHEAVEALQDAGIGDAQIGFLTKKGIQGHFHAPPELGSDMRGAEGATLGTLAGMVTAVAALATPIGPIIAAGPLFGVLVGALAGAATGGLVASMVDFGIDEESARRLAATLEDEQALLLSVEVPQRREAEIRELLAQTDALHADELSFFQAYHQEHQEIDFEEFAEGYHYGYRAAAHHQKPFAEVDLAMRMDYLGDYEIHREAIEIGYNRYMDTIQVMKEQES